MTSQIQPDMQPPARQPLGFWTARAGEAIRARTRGRLADLGLSQPHWWVLHQLSLLPDGVSADDVVATVGPNDSDAVIREAIESGIDNEWIVSTDDGVLSLTPSGSAVFAAAAKAQSELNDERRQGISDADYVTTIQVLQRTIANVGGDAWHW